MIVFTTSYLYSLNLKLGIFKGTELQEALPRVNDFIMTSVEFDTIDDAVESANSVANSLKEKLNHLVGTEKYTIISEVNPNISHMKTISQQWERDELSKLWIVEAGDGSFKGTISAVGLMSISQKQEKTEFLN